MRVSELIAKLKEVESIYEDNDVYVVDHPSEIGTMDAGCPISSVTLGDDGIYICMSDWG